MKKLLILGAALVATLITTAEEKKPTMATKEQMKAMKLTPEKRQQLQMKSFGGYIVDSRNQYGTVVIVNAQSAVDSVLFNDVIKELEPHAKFKYDIQQGEFDIMKPEVRGEASIFVIDNPNMPMSLVAPEAKWVMMNVAPLKTSKEAFFKARVKKEFVRAFSYLFGAANSQYPNCLMGCVTKPEDLDQYVNTGLPVDVLGKFEKYAEGYGITPSRRTTYKAAAQEGWAPAPTNEYQQVIWDQIHQVPTKGIEIKFDPKKGM